MPSIKRTRRRKTWMLKPRATASTGNRNQSLLKSSSKNSMPIAENSSAHSPVTARKITVAKTASVSTRKLRHERTNNTSYAALSRAAQGCRYTSAMKLATTNDWMALDSSEDSGNAPKGDACQPTYAAKSVTMAENTLTIVSVRAKLVESTQSSAIPGQTTARVHSGKLTLGVWLGQSPPTWARHSQSNARPWASARPSMSRRGGSGRPSAFGGAAGTAWASVANRCLSVRRLPATSSPPAGRVRQAAGEPSSGCLGEVRIKRRAAGTDRSPAASRSRSA